MTADDEQGLIVRIAGGLRCLQRRDHSKCMAAPIYYTGSGTAVLAVPAELFRLV
jgi:hypothetical protein